MNSVTEGKRGEQTSSISVCPLMITNSFMDLSYYYPKASGLCLKYATLIRQSNDMKAGLSLSLSLGAD